MRTLKAAAPAVKITTEDPELAERFDRVLGATVEAMDESGLQYAFIGGIASGGLGRPRSTHDIDLFVKPEDAELALRALDKKGFRTVRHDPSWLYKGFLEDILVDVIFKSKGEIYLDPEMYQRTIRAEFHGRQLRLVAPEDLLIIKASAHSELTPSHWHDAIALLSHAELDWDYLIRRARRAPRRILSLLLYAQSNDVWVPNWVVHYLYNGIFRDTNQHPPLHVVGSSGGATMGGSTMGGSTMGMNPAVERMAPPAAHAPQSVQHPGSTESHRSRTSDAYKAAHLRQILAEDPRTNELDIFIEHSGDKVLLRGEVSHVDRREAVGALAKEHFPECAIENQIRILNVQEPSEVEAVK